MSALSREALHLIRTERWGALATLNGTEPSASMVAYAPADDLRSLLFFLSGLAQHTRDLLVQPHASLAVSEPDTHEGDPQRLQRVTIAGEAAPIDRHLPEFFAAGEAYVARFPDALPRFELEDFVLFRFTPTTVRYVGGFARAATLQWEAIRGSE
jgi:putative heme iron utilization protein